MGNKTKIEFNNRAIRNHKSNFMSINGKPLDRVYTPLKISKTTQFKGLNLCEYKKGEKHFVLNFYMKGHKNNRKFTVGRFNDNLDVVTGKTIFGIKQCQERLFKIVDEHCDERGHWVKDPNLTVSFTQINKSITIKDLIEEYCKAGFEKMISGEKMIVLRGKLSPQELAMIPELENKAKQERRRQVHEEMTTHRDNTLRNTRSHNTMYHPKYGGFVSVDDNKYKSTNYGKFSDDEGPY